MRKTQFILLAIFIVNISTFAQDTVSLWPFSGQKAGESILYKPGDYIGSEKVFDELFIAASEGTPVLAPVNGIISNIGYGFLSSLITSTSFHFSAPQVSNIAEYDKQHRKLLAEGKEINAQFISLSIGISCNSGEKYWISGLRPFEFFKTGYKIKKGDIIGYVGFSYKKIPEPCIMLSREINGKPADPMTPFGIKTSYIPPKVVPIKSVVSVSEQISDFEIFRKTLEEGHPGLYDYTSRVDMNLTFEKVRRKITKPISPSSFKSLLQPVLDSLRDGHTNLINVSGQNDNQPRQEYAGLPVRFGFQNDSLIIFQTFSKYKDLLRKQIIKINNETASTLLQSIKYIGYNQEGYNIERIKSNRLWIFQENYRNSHNYNKGDSITLYFSDGTNARLGYQAFSSTDEYIPRRIRKTVPNENNFEFKNIDANTAYLKIKTFGLSGTDEDSLREVINGLSKSSSRNLIIDIRGNPGGNDSYSRLFSMLAEKPFRTCVASMVKSNSRFEFLKYSQSYNTLDTVVLFPEFKKVEGKEGFYLEGSELFTPDDSIHFGGKVYVLVDEHSISSATLFPALVHKFKRGLIIGRETGSSYYQMNAYKFAFVRLPNSMLDLRIPLIKIIFDDQTDPSIPWGHGVIPDYYIGHTFEEFLYLRDPILDFTLNLITNSLDLSKK